MSQRKKIICVDFDGVLHSYTSGWKGADVVADPPVPGALQWLIEMTNHSQFQICIYSARSSQEGGIHAMTTWLQRELVEHGHRQASAVLGAIEFPTEKPPAHLTIDDRAICFRGTFPTVMEMANFRPWNR